MATHDPEKDKSVSELGEDAVIDGTEYLVTSEGKKVLASAVITHAVDLAVGDVEAALIALNG